MKHLWLVIVGSILVFIGLLSMVDYTPEHIAVIAIDGVIVTQGNPGFWDGALTSSAWVVEQLESIKEDDRVRGVILEINSPGGSGVASDEIARAVRELDKPTVAYIRETGASGSYWIASSADYIFTNRLSLVGSIGVFASYLDFSGLLSDYNVTYQRFVAGDRKDFGSPYREPTAQEREHFEELLEELHQIFIAEVAAGRNMSVDAVSALADGSIYTGQRSVALGLTDAIGGKKEAEQYLFARIGKELTTFEYSQQPSLWGGLLSMRIPFASPFLSVRT